MRSAPKRAANGDLVRARSASCQQQVRHVGAREEQHEAYGAEQHEQPLAATLPTSLRQQVSEPRAALATRPAAPSAPGGTSAASSAEACSRETPGARRPMTSRECSSYSASRSRGERHRYPQLLRARHAIECRRHDADHGVVTAVHADAHADHVRRGGELPPPQPVAEHDDVIAVGAILVGGVRATERGRDAEDREEVVRRARAEHPLGRVAGGEVEARVVERGQFRERS